MIKDDISNTVDTRLVTTTSIIAKLVVCAVLLAGIANAKAAERPQHQTKAHSNLAKLERDWKRLHSSGQRAMLGRLVACGELGRCEGLALHPALAAARVRAAAIDENDGGIASPPDGGAAQASP